MYYRIHEKLKIKYYVTINNKIKHPKFLKYKDNVLVKVSSKIPIKEIENFIEKNYDKIMSLRNTEINYRFYKDNNEIVISDKLYIIKLEIDNTEKYEYQGDNLKVRAINANRLNSIIYNDVLCDITRKRIQYLARKHQDLVSGVTFAFKVMKGRFGSCNKTKKRISINILLGHYEDKVIDYIFYHEIAHLIHANHSKEFYDLLANYFPDYKIAERKLKKGGIYNDH